MVKKLIFSLLLLSCIYAQTAVAPAAGDGSISNPYQITTLENLYWIAADSLNWDKHYIQTADIDAAACKTWRHEANHYGWYPIGTQDTPFIGSYNGQGFIIDSLCIYQEIYHYEDPNNNQYVIFENFGLFGSILNAKISNVFLKDVDFDIYNSNNIGALVGLCDSSIISRCSFKGEIIGEFCTGGLIGCLKNSTVSECFTLGRVQATGNCNPADYYYGYHGWAGGIAAYTKSSDISNCYSSSVVSATYTHPITPERPEKMAIIINNCYCLEWGSSYDGYERHYYGILGETNFMLQGNYYDYFWSDKDKYNSAMKTEVELKYPTTYLEAGWDFVIEMENGTEDIWDIDRTGVINNGYPFLHWEHPETTYFTSIEENQIPENFCLNQNYPNPFNPITTISYQLSSISDVRMIIFDLSGRKTQQWTYQNQIAGSYEITWNGKDQNGNPVPSGVYIYRMVVGEFEESKKMVLLK